MNLGETKFSHNTVLKGTGFKGMDANYTCTRLSQWNQLPINENNLTKGTLCALMMQFYSINKTTNCSLFLMIPEYITCDSYSIWVVKSAGCGAALTGFKIWILLPLPVQLGATLSCSGPLVLITSPTSWDSHEDQGRQSMESISRVPDTPYTFNKCWVTVYLILFKW